MISAATLHLVAELRAKGALFVVISGARLSTLLMRLPYLPAADAYVCENGGRILYPGSDLPTGAGVGVLTHVSALPGPPGPLVQPITPQTMHDGMVGSFSHIA